MKRFKEYAIITMVGGVYYFLLEILWRGYSHWAMIIVGGISAAFLYLINEKLSAVSFFSKCLLGAGIITAAELLSGIVVNLWLLWMLLCIPAFVISDIVKEIFLIKGANSGKKI